MRRAPLYLMLLAACSGSGPTTPAPPVVTGEWVGLTSDPDAVDITIAENNGVVSGAGTLITITQTYALTVSGSFTGSAISLTMTTGLHPPINLAGTITGGYMKAALNGSGFLNDTLTLRKQ